MEKVTPSAPGFNLQPPPYAEVAPQILIHPTVRSVPIPAVYETHHHHGHYGSGSVLQTHIVTRQPVVRVHIATSTPLFGEIPRTMVCTSCNRTITTNITKQPTTRTHVLALALCMVGCFLCAPCVYCTNCCMSVSHHCPECNSYQGTFIPGY